MSKHTKSARGQECTLRFYNSCDPETVVACHIKRKGHGITGGKPSDLFTIHACARCHDILDMRDMSTFAGFIRGANRYDQWVLSALIETQSRGLDNGNIEVK